MIAGTAGIYCKDKNTEKFGGPGKKKKGCAQKICTGSIVDKVSIILVIYNYTCTA